MQGIFRIARQAAFIALVLRALLPAGWMPDAAGLTICTLGVIHHHPAPGHQPDTAGHHDSCPFAAAAQLAFAREAPRLALPARHILAARNDRDYAAAIATRFAPQTARAPPLKA